MIERIERQHSYSMNHIELPITVCPEPEEALEFRRIRLSLPKRRVAGEALVKFGPPTRVQQKPSLARGSAPFDLLPRHAKTLQDSVTSVPIAASKFDRQMPDTSPAKSRIDETAVIVLSPKRRPHIGQEIQLDGKRAIITWLGDKKFEVVIAGLETKERFKYSEYPGVRGGKSRIKRIGRETGSVAS